VLVILSLFVLMLPYTAFLDLFLFLFLLLFF